MKNSAFKYSYYCSENHYSRETDFLVKLRPKTATLHGFVIGKLPHDTRNAGFMYSKAVIEWRCYLKSSGESQQ